MEMKKNIFKIILLFVLLLSCFSCGKRNIHKTEGKSSMYGYEMIVNMRQVDSICLVDTLWSIDKWTKTTFIDYETNEPYVKRMFIKDYSDNYEVTYILIEQDTLFRIIKRIGKTE